MVSFLSERLPQASYSLRKNINSDCSVEKIGKIVSGLISHMDLGLIKGKYNQYFFS